MKRMIFSASVLETGLILACLASVSFAQLGPMRPGEEAPFELSPSQEFDTLAHPVLVVSTSIPYRWLVFFVRGASFESSYRVYMALKDARGKDLRGEVWEETVSAADFRETTSPTIAATSRRSFPLAAGDYRVAVTIEIIGTSRRFTKERPVRLVGKEAGMLGVSAPVFHTVPGDSGLARPPAGTLLMRQCPPEEARAFRINPGGIYGDFESWVRFVYTVATDREGGGMALAVRVRDARGRLVLYRRMPLEAAMGDHFTACVDLNVDSFELGEYDVNAVVEGPDGAGAGMSRGSFTVLLDRSLLDARFGDLVDILGAVAAAPEREAFAATPAGERGRAWAAYWKKHDPTPSTAANEAYGEFVERLAVVVKSFSKLRPGWRTDMGKIYLQNGAPDKVEDRQDSMLGRSFQLWYYHSKGVVYLFEDSAGNGDYRLFSTEMI